MHSHIHHPTTLRALPLVSQTQEVEVNMIKGGMDGKKITHGADPGRDRLSGHPEMLVLLIERVAVG